MPSLSAQASVFRRGGYTFTGYISTPPETIVLQGTITAVPTYPAKQLSYTLSAGSEANVIQDMKVDFFSSGGTKKATLRVASGQTVTSTVLPVGEFAKGVYDVAVNDTFKVYKIWNIHDRLVSATAALNKDSRIAYSDQGANPNPVCNSGGAIAGENTSLNFYGATSYTIDPDSSGTLTHAWDFGDGTPSTDTAASPTGISFPAGFRWVKHTVTDTGNSKTAVQYVPTWVHDSSYPALAVQMDNLSASVEQGWRCSFKLPVGTEGSITNLPDGALIVYWEREKYNGTETSYGSLVSNRSTVKFVGYLVSDSIHIEPDSNEVIFEAVSPLAILEQTPALPQLIVSATSPSGWSQLKSLSTKKMFWYLSFWHSSLQDVFDFVWNDGLDISYQRIAVEGDSIAEQLRDIGNGLNIQVTCDRLGRILFTRDPDFLTSGERSSRVTTYDLTTADVMELDVTRNHRGTVKFVRGEGITSANAPVFSNAPGNAPAPYGVGSDTLTKQIVTSQSVLNTRTGVFFAKVNALYNGQFVPKGARLKLPDGYDVFDPAYREFITLALASTYNTRAVGWSSSERWTLEGVDITYDLERGAKEITLTIDHETLGADGVTYIPPQEGNNGLPEFPPLETDFPPLGTDPGTGTGVDPGAPGGTASPASADMAAFCTDNNLYLTSTFDTPESADGPTWAATDLSGLANWGGGDLIAFVADPYSAAYIDTGSTVDGWIVTTTHVQRITDIFGTVALETAFALSDTSSNRTMMFERATQNFGIVATFYGAAGVEVAVTTDGDNWTETVLTAHDNTESSGVAPGIWISPTTEGLAYVAVWTTTGDDTSAVAQVYKTVNSGSSWALLTSPALALGVEISSFLKVPLSNAGTTVYHRKKDPDLILNRNVSGTETDITPELASVPYVPAGARISEASIAETDSNTLAYIGFTGNTGSLLVYDFTVSQYGFTIPPPSGTATNGYGQYVASTGFTMTLTGGFYFGSAYNTVSVSQVTEIRLYLSDSVSTARFHYNQAVQGDFGATQVNATYSTSGGNHYKYTFSTPTDIDDLQWYLDELGASRTVTRLEFDGVLAPENLQFGLFVTHNAAADAPDWTTVETGDEDTMPYRQVFALTPSKYLVMGMNGAIGIADDDGIDSRMGDISTTGEIVGSCAL